MSGPILRLRGISKHFPVREGFARPRLLRAVDGVDLEVQPGETVGLVGESGSGKSTLARLALRLETPTSGRVEIEGRDVTDLDAAAMRPLRRVAQIVLQDPSAALDPRHVAGRAIAEGLKAHSLATSPADERAKVVQALERVGLRAEHAERYPHELSGGQRQRVSIARALAVQPRLLALDEPVSALDVSVQAQIVNLLRDLQDELGLAYLFVAHDLAVVRWTSHRIAVMYLGRIVESGPAESVWSAPLHPYTQALLRAIPSPDPKRRVRLEVVGDAPSPLDPPTGCAFHPRCPIAQPGLCDVRTPALEDKRSGHAAACHLAR